MQIQTIDLLSLVRPFVSTSSTMTNTTIRIPQAPFVLIFKDTKLVRNERKNRCDLLALIETALCPFGPDPTWVNLTDYLQDHPNLEAVLHEQLSIPDFAFFVTDHGQILIEETKLRGGKKEKEVFHLNSPNRFSDISKMPIFLSDTIEGRIRSVIGTPMPTCYVSDITLSCTRPERFCNTYIVRFTVISATFSDRFKRFIHTKEPELSEVFFYGIFPTATLHHSMMRTFENVGDTLFLNYQRDNIMQHGFYLSSLGTV